MNPEEREDYLVKEIATAQQKYIYFILAANGSAIGFTVQLIISKNITDHLWGLFLAIIIWGLSFFSGCKFLLASFNVMAMELYKYNLLADMRKYNFIEEERLKENIKSRGHFKRMFVLLITGMIVFILWFFASQISNLKW